MTIAASIKKRDTLAIVAGGEFESESAAREWLSYQVPELAYWVNLLEIGKPLDVGGHFILTLGEEEKPSSIALEVETPSIKEMGAHQAITAVNRQTDPEVLTLMADAERNGDRRKSVLDAIAKRIEAIQAK